MNYRIISNSEVRVSNPSRAFVIGPIGDPHAEIGSEARTVYEDAIQVVEEVITPACSAFGIEAFRADDIHKTGEIPEQVFRMLRDMPIVIADLTCANANVMYELGMRHTTGKLTIQIGEKNRLPFDISVIRTILFVRTPAGLVEARKRLSQTLAVGLSEGGDPVTATRIWFEYVRDADISSPDSQEAGTGETEEAEALEQPSEEEDEAGFLDKLADTEFGMQSLTQAMIAGTTISQEITQIVTEGTAELTSLDKAGGNSSQRLAVVNRVAARLEGPVARMSVVAGDYLQSAERLGPGLKYLLERASVEPEFLSSYPPFLAQVQALIDGARTSGENTVKFREAVRGSSAMSRSLRRVSTKLVAALDLMIVASNRIASLGESLRR